MLLRTFFKRCEPEHLKGAVQGAQTGREWLERFITNKATFNGFMAVVQFLHRKWWGTNRDGYWAAEDSLGTAVLCLLEQAAPKLDPTRNPAEVLAECLLWTYHAVTRSITRERQWLARADIDEVYPEPSTPGLKVPQKVPEALKGSVATILFARWGQDEAQ